MQKISDNLRFRYIIGLTSIAVLTLIAQFLIQFQIIQQETDANIINIAGRQRMLSQQLTTDALQFQFNQDNSDIRSNLEETLVQWETAHLGLKNGDTTLNLPGDNSDAIIGLFEYIETHFTAMVTATHCLLDTDSLDCGTTSDSVAIILEHEDDFLMGMDRIVDQYAREAETEVQQLRVVEYLLASLVILALILEAFLIFRPAELQIRSAFTQLEATQKALQSTNDQLEIRVAERTQQLSQMNTQLRQSNEDLLMFSQVLAHDLKSPIAIAKGFTNEIRMDWQTLSQSLKRDDFDDQLQYIVDESIPSAIKSLGTSLQTLEHLLNLINKLSQEDRRELVFEKIDTRPLLDNILEMYRPDIQKKGISITIGDLPMLNADRLSIERTFANLIDNAIKYTDPTRKAEIKIYGTESDTAVIYYVEDNGIGISKDDYEKIFQLFERAGNPRDTEGEGIGLYAIRNLIRRHSGSIEFESTVDKGSVFYFSIPKQLVMVSDEKES